MILLEIDANRIALMKLKCDAPRPVHMNRVTNRAEAMQRMVIESRQVHLVRPCTRIKPVQPQQNAVVKPFVDLGGPAS